MFDQNFILPTNYIPSTAEFLSELRIRPGGFGAQLATGVYKQIFVWSVDLRDQYERYYCVEYNSLGAYLEVAHDLQLQPDELEKKHILKVKSPGGLLDEAYSDNYLDVVVDCIRKLEAGANED